MEMKPFSRPSKEKTLKLFCSKKIIEFKLSIIVAKPISVLKIFSPRLLIVREIKEADKINISQRK